MASILQFDFPAGVILPYAGTAAPDGWLLCTGSAINRTTYSRLFNAIGIAYGAGDGVDTFNLPNTQGVFLRGAGAQILSGLAFTATRGATQTDTIQGHYHNKSETNHSHTYSDPGHSHQVGIITTRGSGSQPTSTVDLSGAEFTDPAYVGITINGATSNVSITSASSDGTNGTPRTSSETRPANVGVNYIIKI
jgi:microcystin-dependent protein